MRARSNREGFRASRWVRVPLGLCLLVAGSTSARAERNVVTASSGLIRLEKRTPLELSTTSALVRIEAGRRLGNRTSARIRVGGFRADGLNLFVALVAEIDLSDHLGLNGFAGLSAGADSGLGNNAGIGGFARWFATDTVAIRGDAFASLAMRNDFGGLGFGLLVGTEWRPGR
jgi:hypothetical protein